MSDPTAADQRCMAVITGIGSPGAVQRCEKPVGHDGDHVVEEATRTIQWGEVFVASADPTASEAAAKELANITGDHPWHKHFHTCVRVLDALGIDPDSPLSLLQWHASVTDRESLARQVEDLVPDLSDDPHTAGYAQALLDVLQLIDPDRSTR